METTQVCTRPEVASIKTVYGSYDPCENEYYCEFDREYLAAVKAPRRRLLCGRQTAMLYREEGYLRIAERGIETMVRALAI